jgi:uncharacterized protein (UPF0261 family)
LAGQRRIVLIATLDTKGEEANYIKSLVAQKGHIPTLIDAGVFRSQYSCAADVSNDEVANSVGLSIQEVQNSKEEDTAISLMAKGASIVVEQLLAEGKIDGLICIGGSMGTSLGLKIMRDIPINIPKLMVSTIAFTPTIPLGSTSIDQTMMQTIADLRGLNTITRMVLKRATGAICGMVEAQDREESKKNPVVGITGLGGHKVVEYCRSLLLERGYEPIIFHSVGTNACEKLVADGFVDALIDLSMFELVNFVCGGDIKGAERKISAACEKGLSQVIAPGAIDFFAWSRGLDTLPAKYRDRNIHIHNPLVILVPTTEEERVSVLNIIIERVNQTRGPTALLVPSKGFSRLDREGMPFYDPNAGENAFGVLKRGIINSLVKLTKIDAHINDTVFAEAAVSELVRLRSP